MQGLIIELISRVCYLVLCYIFLSTIAYLTYGCQWEYAFALLSKANQNSDYNFSESIVWETSFQTLTYGLTFDVTKQKPITHSSFSCHAIWLINMTYIFPTMAYGIGFTFTIYALLMLAKICFHLQGFLNPGMLNHGFFSGTVYWWYLLTLYFCFTDGWLFLANAIAELAIEPIDCELKPIKT